MADAVRWSGGPGETFPPHEHAYRKTITCVRGSIVFIVKDRTVTLDEGRRLVLAPGTAHSAVAGPRGCECEEVRE